MTEAWIAKGNETVLVTRREKNLYQAHANVHLPRETQGIHDHLHMHRFQTHIIQVHAKRRIAHMI